MLSSLCERTIPVCVAFAISRESIKLMSVFLTSHVDGMEQNRAGAECLRELFTFLASALPIISTRHFGKAGLNVRMSVGGSLAILYMSCVIESPWNGKLPH